MMKSKLWRTSCVGLFVLISTTVDAALIDQLDGTVLDTDLNIYWMKDAGNASGPMTWLEAQNWIVSLNNTNYLGFNNWRLPQVAPVNGIAFDITNSFDGSTDNGYNITSLASELSYMYHINLGNLALYDTAGNFSQPGWGLKNTGPFTGLSIGAYWTAIDNPTDSSQAFIVGMGNGHQNFFAKDTLHNVWAVRDTSVPLPAAVWLFSSGLLGLFGITRKRHQIDRD